MLAVLEKCVNDDNRPYVTVIYWSTSASTVRNLFFGVDVTAREKARNVYKSTREVQVMNKANILSISKVEVVMITLIYMSKERAGLYQCYLKV